WPRRAGALALPAVPVVLAFALAAIVLAVAGHDPLDVYGQLLTEAFGSRQRIASTLAASTPLILSGLAIAVAFRAGAFNVGVEGCIYV
ncbi:hypothetical protein ABTM52_19895, partial [Acinetobacter baumannii]